MKATFEDFLLNYPMCKQYEGNIDAIALFDFLSNDDNIFKMLDFSENRKPALLGCVREFEAFYDTLTNPSFDLSENFAKRAIGRMVATIIAPFGYAPENQVIFSKAYKGKYIKSATRYEKKHAPTLRVVRVIERI